MQKLPPAEQPSVVLGGTGSLVRELEVCVVRRTVVEPLAVLLKGVDEQSGVLVCLALAAASREPVVLCLGQDRSLCQLVALGYPSLDCLRVGDDGRVAAIGHI